MVRRALSSCAPNRIVSQDLFQGVLGKEESLLLVQWFSGFQECSSVVRGLRSIFSNSLVLK